MSRRHNSASILFELMNDGRPDTALNSDVLLRPAAPGDIPTLERWDRDPDVIACHSDDAASGLAAEGGAPTPASDDQDWARELRDSIPGISEYLIAELRGRPIGVLQIIDPHQEPTHYWGDVGPGLRAIDIWIGDPADRGKRLGETMMRLALQRCFADPNVSAILIDPLASNTRAHKFYQRLGFVPVGRQHFGEDDCLVHRLERATWRARFPED